MLRPMADSTLVASLLAAWKGGAPLPAGTAPPADTGAAYAVQDALIAGLGPRGGWKIGAADPQTRPQAAPLPASCLIPSGTSFTGTMHGVELELALRLGRDLPAGAPITLADFDAILPVLELVETRLEGWADAPALLKLADLQTHGALVLGAPVSPDLLDFGGLDAELRFDGAVVGQSRGGNAAGTLEHLLAELTRRQVTVKKGEIITTGALTGMIPAKPGTAVVGRLAGIGEVSVRFAG